MVHKTLQQYLELMKNSGIDDLCFTVSAVPKQDVSQKRNLLENKREAYKDCSLCNLHRQRLNFVYGEGSPDAQIMLIGEGPGSEENKQGKPFIGRAGQLLTRMLHAINLPREEVYITNIVKCQPPGNRNPLPEEVRVCLPYLREQIEIIAPQILVLLGKVAAVALFDVKEPMNLLRQKDFSFEGIETFITYHPAALIYNQSLKKESWADLKKIRARYDAIQSVQFDEGYGT